MAALIAINGAYVVVLIAVKARAAYRAPVLEHH